MEKKHTGMDWLVEAFRKPLMKRMDRVLFHLACESAHLAQVGLDAVCAADAAEKNSS